MHHEAGAYRGYGVLPMAIQNGDFIRLIYTGKVDGAVFDTTDEEVAREAGIHNPEALYGPVTIRVGSQHVITGFDEASRAGMSGTRGRSRYHLKRRSGRTTLRTWRRSTRMLSARSPRRE